MAAQTGLDPTGFDPSDTARLRGALGRFATGVTVITALAPEGAPIGFTASSFNSVSLDPALILWSLSRRSERLGAYRAADAYAVNVLGAGQAALARRFAGPVETRFDGVAWRRGRLGAPVLDGVIAVFECSHEAVYPAGDHELFIGRVSRCAEAQGAPLTFFGGDFGTVLGAVERAAAPDPLRAATARAAAALGRARAAALAAEGLDEAQWARLSRLGAAAPGAHAPADADAALERAGLAARRDGALVLSAAGVAARARVEKAEAAWEESCLAGLDAAEVATLTRLLARIQAPD